MKNQEGLRVSLLEEGMLDSAGVLTGNQACTSAYGLPDAAVQLFLLIATAGPEGLAQSKIPKELRDDLSVHLLHLELQELVAWERDNRGRPAYLVLTWKGEETFAAAKTAPCKSASWAARRRASVARPDSY